MYNATPPSGKESKQCFQWLMADARPNTSSFDIKWKKKCRDENLASSLIPRASISEKVERSCSDKNNKSELVRTTKALNPPMLPCSTMSNTSALIFRSSSSGQKRSQTQISQSHSVTLWISVWTIPLEKQQINIGICSQNKLKQTSRNHRWSLSWHPKRLAFFLITVMTSFWAAAAIGTQKHRSNHFDSRKHDKTCGRSTDNWPMIEQTCNYELSQQCLQTWLKKILEGST